jgi:hypothetical protein
VKELVYESRMWLVCLCCTPDGDLNQDHVWLKTWDSNEASKGVEAGAETVAGAAEAGAD